MTTNFLQICEQFSNHVGIIGVILTLLAYFLINLDKVTSTSVSYVWLNLIGSILLLYSLLFHWNLSSVLIEIAWISISLIGLYRIFRLRLNIAIKEE